MQVSCLFAELDEPTRDYLLGVVKSRGRGAPGIYLSESSWAPWVAFFLGPVIFLVSFCAGIGSGKGAWAIAMLQTAGVVLGGWLMIFAIRRWFGAGSEKYPGKFLYFDPLHVYQCAGEGITITSLQSVQAVTAVPGDGGFRMAFDLGDDRVLWVPMPSPGAAALVEDYYAAMADVERQENSPFVSGGPAMIGAASVYAAREGELPRGLGDIALESEEIATAPEKSRSAGMGLGPLLILASGVLVFFLFWTANATVGESLSDNQAFQQAKLDGAPGLRVYLLDESHTRHREEAKNLLAAQYTPVITRLSQPPAPSGLPDHVPSKIRKTGMVPLMEMLQTADSPAVSIVTRFKQATGQTVVDPNLQRDLADGLARSLDPKLIAFAAPPDGKAAHIEVEVSRAADNSHLVRVRIRTKLDQAPVADETFPITMAMYTRASRGPNPLAIAICEEMTGSWTPAPPPPQDF